MCGIVALWSTSQAEPPIAPERLRRATDALLHRGPDGRGEWLADDGRVGLGHTRLVLIDPLADQPLANEDGSIRIVVNGEFYDFERARVERTAGDMPREAVRGIGGIAP